MLLLVIVAGCEQRVSAQWSRSEVVYRVPATRLPADTLYGQPSVLDADTSALIMFEMIKNDANLSRLGTFFMTKQPNGWSSPALLPNMTPPAGNAQVVQDKRGDLHFFWREYVAGFTRPWAKRLLHSTLSFGRWSEPRIVFSYDLDTTHPDFPRDSRIDALNSGSVAVGNDNTLYIVFGTSDRQFASRARFAFFRNRQWSTPDTIGNSFRGIGNNPAIALDSQGRFFCASIILSENDGGFQRVYIATSDDFGKTWTTPVPVSPLTNTAAFNPQILTDSRGRIHLIWQRGSMLVLQDSDETVWHSFSDNRGRTWSQPAQITSASQPSLSTFRAIADKEDNIHLMISSNTQAGAQGQSKIHYTTWRSNRWLPAIELRAGSIAANNISISPQGNIVIAYTDGNLESAGIYLTRSTIATSSASEPSVAKPTAFELFQNYPNPFNPTTVISYQLPVAGQVSLKIYDVLGREVATLVNQRQEPGRYNATFNAAGLSSGAYFYRLSVRPSSAQAGSFVSTKKMMLVR